MPKSYTSNFVKIYFWQGISILLNFISLFIVTPKLTSQPVIYGTYMVCVSATIFLAYADLGFVSAGFKFASEYFSKGDRISEVKVTGFSTFILLVFVGVISFTFFLLSIHPQCLFGKISSDEETNIASKLFFILSIFSVNVVFQRLLLLIFGSRLEDYIYQRINIIVSIIKISSVFYFFRIGVYDIVGYFLFSQALGGIGSLLSLYIAKKRYSYDLTGLLINIKFTKDQFELTKGLAFSSLYLTFVWIVYYELDSFAIARLAGAKSVAYFAVGFTLMSVFRTIFGTIYSPFQARFNHFIGNNDRKGLNSFYLNVIAITLPIVLFPVLSVMVLMKPFILCWIGPEYSSSILIATFLLSIYLVSYISYPAGILMTSLVKIKEMYLINSIIAIVYWSGIALTFHILNITAFGVFKSIAFLISGIYYIWFTLKTTELSLSRFFNQIIKPALLPVVIMLLSLITARFYLPEEKSKINLTIVISCGVVSTMIALTIYFFTSLPFKTYILRLKRDYFIKGI